MDLAEIFLESLGTLTLNKMRTGLAILGIVIGIASVITLVSLGQASQKQIENQIQSLGANLLTVQPGAAVSGGVREAFGGMTTLTYEDAKAIGRSQELSNIVNVSPELQRRSQVTAGRNNTNTQILGVTPEYVQVRNLSIESGNFIQQADLNSLSKVAVLGPQVVEDLFGEGASPVGQTIRINKMAFTIIGVTASRGGTGFMNQDDIIFTPLTTAQKQLFGVDYLSSLAVAVRSQEVMEQTRDEVGYFLLGRHKITTPEQADFRIMSQTDVLNTASQVTGTFTALLSGIAAISLLVGGIGIMNIMLVTVTERTREVGLRKALGAKKKTIISQFLMEAIILTFTGGLIGMVLGIILFAVVSRLISLPFVVSFFSIFLAITVSGFIGVVFGWYPARKAAMLSPIEALRYE
jgi:putative ABC transport system permease protein